MACDAVVAAALVDATLLMRVTGREGQLDGLDEPARGPGGRILVGQLRPIGLTEQTAATQAISAFRVGSSGDRPRPWTFALLGNYHGASIFSLPDGLCITHNCLSREDRNQRIIARLFRRGP
jgi:hypothetical protein